MNEKQISVKLADDIIQTLDKHAASFGKTRHDLIKGILEMGVDEINDLQHVGVFQLGMLVRDLHYGIKDKLGMTPKAKNEGEGKPIPIKLSEDFIGRLDELAARADISRHHLMKNFIKVGLEELAVLEKVGLFKVATLLRDLRKGFKQVCSLGEKAFKATGGKQKGGD